MSFEASKLVDCPYRNDWRPFCRLHYHDRDRRQYSAVSFALLSLIHQSFIICFLAAGLLLLDLLVFPLKAASLPLSCNSFLNKILCAVLLIDSRAVPFRWPLDDCSNLRKCGDFVLSRRLFVVTMGVKNGSHFDDLKIAFQLRS
jgi:hypothetical protein